MSQQPQPPRQEPSRANQPQPQQPVTRAGVVWTAVVVALIVLILLIVFFLQNQDSVRVYFLGLGGYVPLGLALFIAAVAGGVLVAVAGAVRILQLRLLARRSLRTKPPTAAKR
ncbi:MULTISPECIES: lipopolysaccharide assembly protein LapA domain-containing protein [Arthrobacter]|uniref:LapA family protein n=1 Tax=Arthrobacter TaxID=1663 RepID=UPI0026C9EDB1|nr:MULTISPECIES: lipopolysaccharide assembly protein LapA domain-containing protein [Arthrobacter]